MLPFELTPLFKAKPWGGRRLENVGKRLPEGAIGESWEVADLPSEIADPGRTLIRTGPHAGRSLSDLIITDAYALLGNANPWTDGAFPLLVKILDANEHLSVQVHPDAAYAASHPPAVTKSETWFVLDADPGAILYSGLQPGVTHDDLTAAAGTPDIVELLRSVPAVPGEFHDLPAGTIHALGAGVMVAEVQTPSDTTYRLYDWQHEYGRTPRELHIDHALAASRIESRPAPLKRLPSGGRTAALTPYYQLSELARAPEVTAAGSLSIVMVVEGTVDVNGEKKELGTTMVVPAASPAVTLDARNGRALIVHIGVESRTGNST